MSIKVPVKCYLDCIPSIVIQQVLEDDLSLLPKVQSLEAVAMLLHLSITTESYAKMDDRELLITIESNIKSIAISIKKFGGDIMKLTSNTIIVLWSKNETIEQIPERAVNCALQIQELLNSTQEMTILLAKIGIGAGKCEILYIGDSSHKTEYLPIGEALAQASQCVNGASEGQVIVSKESWKLMKDACIGAVHDESDNYLIKRCKAIDTLLLSNHIM